MRYYRKEKENGTVYECDINGKYVAEILPLGEIGPTSLGKDKWVNWDDISPPSTPVEVDEV